jgi:hypothetical protein
MYRLLAVPRIATRGFTPPKGKSLIVALMSLAILAVNRRSR